MGNMRSKPETPEDGSKKPQSASQSTVTIPRLDTDFLREPPDESSIKRSWIQLSNLIDAHVETFFNTNEHLGLDHESIIHGLRLFHIVQAPREAEELAELLQTPRHRRLGLRVCIARVVLSSIDFYGHPEETSLDAQVVQLLGRFNRLRPNPGPEEEAALAHWRMITAFFLEPGFRDLRERRPPCVDRLTRFLTVFRPASDGSDTEAEDRNWTSSLNVIAQQSIEIGEKLFCHPSTWLFQWHIDLVDGHPIVDCRDITRKHKEDRETSIRGPSPIVLFPALVEPLTNDGGRKKGRVNVAQAADIGPGLVFLKGEIVPLSLVVPHRPSSPATSITTHSRTTSTTITNAMGYGVDSGITILNGSFTLAQTISALKNASSEIKRTTQFLATVQARIEYTKSLRDQAFDVTNADTSKDEVFNMAQAALRNIHSITTECSNTLEGSTKSITKKAKDGTQHTTTETRFKWVLDGKITYNAKLQEMQIHYQTLMRETDVLQRKLTNMGHPPLPPALPFGDFELFDNKYLSPGRRDGISRHLSPRQSIEMLGEASDSDEGPSDRDSGIGIASSRGDVSDSVDDQG
ncbi:hypothetical protein NUW58_g3370 [Xylaria curta]|uniref:Uncharacterized protein n=1 Tax=Xylaria curta TaxID=42375 RepID=A0ACC1PBB0_9PEZI|nr:hypothetical protein NUW58_g3370 [Xylaria curta]